MKQNYFIYNGKQYNSGDTIVLRRSSCASGNVCNTNAKFLYFDTDENKYYVTVYGEVCEYTKERFDRDFREPYSKSNNTTERDTHPKKYTFKDELNIDGLLIAWAWYIFIMAVGIIFYDVIGIWILASVVFFDYRNKKLKEAGYK